MERINLMMTDDDKDKLQELADAHGRTMSGMIRWLITQAHYAMAINVPIVGTISNEGITLKKELDRR